jgi:tRNA pseudouridine55 synthase
VKRLALHGVLLIDKPAGITSADVVRAVKRRLGAGKVGHLGTLDPFATGLLPVCLGEASKIVPFLNQEDKVYRGVLRLGVATDTLDATGRVVERAPVPAIDRAALEEVGRRFCGSILQVPPMYSAIKRGGVALHRLARRGVEVEREPRPVRIDALALELCGPDEVAFEVRCSKGTYVRVLGADLARALGTVGHVASLRRTAFGRFDVREAAPLDRIGPEEPLPLLTPRTALGAPREFAVDSETLRALRSGQQWHLRHLPAPEPGESLAALIGPAGELVAVVGAEQGRWKLLRVLGPLAVASEGPRGTGRIA